MKVEIYMIENDVYGVDYQQIIVKFFVYFFFDFVVYVSSIIRVEFVNYYFIRQLDLYRGKVKVQLVLLEQNDDFI